MKDKKEEAINNLCKRCKLPCKYPLKYGKLLKCGDFEPIDKKDK